MYVPRVQQVMQQQQPLAFAFPLDKPRLYKVTSPLPWPTSQLQPSTPQVAPRDSRPGALRNSIPCPDFSSASELPYSQFPPGVSKNRTLQSAHGLPSVVGSRCCHFLTEIHHLRQPWTDPTWGSLVHADPHGITLRRSTWDNLAQIHMGNLAQIHMG